MLKPRTIKIFVLLVLAHGLLVLLATIVPGSPLDSALLAPLLVVYALHKVGVPGMLESDGLCGWGWCSPTGPGWLAVAVLSVATAWLVAWALGRLTDCLAKS